MSNVKVVPPDAFIMNCKIVYNDLGQIRQRVSRMWASANHPYDYSLLNDLEEKLETILHEVKNRLEI